MLINPGAKPIRNKLDDARAARLAPKPKLVVVPGSRLEKLVQVLGEAEAIRCRQMIIDCHPTAGEDWLNQHRMSHETAHDIINIAATPIHPDYRYWMQVMNDLRSKGA